MPLYVYACHTCELELEELHPLGQAPERSIRCPLCGGYFERAPGLFHQGSAARCDGGQEPKLPPRRRHAPGCPCCFPARPQR